MQKYKCGTRAKFCEMLGVWGKVFRKIRFACLLIFGGILAGRATGKNTHKMIKSFYGRLRTDTKRSSRKRRSRCS
ncbi:MAG: hypothetical protein KBC98_01360, partial [Candidatus Pacebacteria bacterium]|nr:hypothetical protein [Candidatus Paceibacterota bacterium]